METTEDLQTDTVLQSPEIERSKTRISDQRIHILLDTRTIARIEEHLTRLGKGSFAQALRPQRPQGLDQTDTFGEGSPDEFSCRLTFPDNLLEASLGKWCNGVRGINDDLTSECLGILLDQRYNLPVGDGEDDKVGTANRLFDAGSNLFSPPHFV